MSDTEEAAAKKRKRSRKFSEEEKSSLVNADQTEKKYPLGAFTNEVTLKSRRDAWARVTTKINAVNLSGTLRDVEQVIKKWSDLKLSAKPKVAKYWREMKKTGGGPSEAEIPSPMDFKIVAVIGKEAAKGILGAQELPWLSSESEQSESAQSRKVHCGPTAQNLAKLFHTELQSQPAISGHPQISGGTVAQDQPFSSQPFDIEGLATQELPYTDYSCPTLLYDPNEPSTSKGMSASASCRGTQPSTDSRGVSPCSSRSSKSSYTSYRKNKTDEKDDFVAIQREIRDSLKEMVSNQKRLLDLAEKVWLPSE